MEDLVPVQGIVASRKRAAGQGRDGIEFVKEPLGFTFPGNLLSGEFAQGSECEGGSTGSPAGKRGENEETIRIVFSTGSYIAEPIATGALPLLQGCIERRTHVFTADEDTQEGEENTAGTEGSTHMRPTTILANACTHLPRGIECYIQQEERSST